jgi:nucleoside-diphosphate-sugar epimerase
LIDRGHPVTVVAHRPASLPGDLLDAAERGVVRVCRGALENPDGLARAVRGAHTVVHMATGSGSTWREVQDAMVDGSIALARASLREGVARFIYVSSIAALDAGRPRSSGTIEDSLQTDPRPDLRDVYSRGKIATERALVDLHRTHGLPLIIVRPGVVVGRDASYRHAGLGEWMNGTHCLGWGRGNHAIPLVLVDDVADGIARLVDFDGSTLDGRAINLCSRVPLSARDVVEAIAVDLGRPVKFHPRPLAQLLTIELAKWGLKKLMRRSDVLFPAYSELRSRALPVPFTSNTARQLLGWKPVEEPARFLALAAAGNPAVKPPC